MGLTFCSNIMKRILFHLADIAIAIISFAGLIALMHLINIVSRK